jgi:phosphate transport system substrate-binding protein
MFKKIATATVAALLTLPLAAGATTVSPLYVAGGTLAGFPFYDLGNASLFPNSADTGATCKSATEDCAVELLYAAVGTGSAQLSFLDHDGQGSVGSGNPPDTDPVTFPTVTFPYGDLDFAQGDAPLSITQFSSYETTLNGSGTDLARWGAASVVPLLSGPVAIAYNPAGTGLPNGQALQLSLKSLCGIFTGTITNWDDALLATDNPGVTFNNLPITSVVRSVRSRSIAAPSPE